MEGPCKKPVATRINMIEFLRVGCVRPVYPHHAPLCDDEINGLRGKGFAVVLQTST